MKTESVQSYYDHGPLFRTQLGEERVQGMDYAYTLQGWIKGVNGSGLNAAKDIGRDGYISGGNLNQPVARDAFGFTLNYFNGIYDGGTTLYHDGDYTPVTPAMATFAAAPTGTGGAFDTHSKDLFNGNIRYTTLQLKGVDTIPVAYAYRNDQLQRLKEVNFFNASIDASTYSLNNATAASGDYHEAYTYDGNGNILTLDRRGYYSSGQDEMDSLVYFYDSGKNRLNYIRDTVAAGNYSVDLDSQTPNNYSYDESGNLISDAKEKLSAVTWSPYGKIKNIAKSLDTVNIAYSYDASMNRVVKKYTTAHDTTKTYYIRGAQGNVLAVYELKRDSLQWAEQHLYGSSRLGLIEKSILLNAATTNVNKPGTTGLVIGIKRNARRYELTNHLGNVLSVISDVKRPKTEISNTYYDVDRIAVNDYYPFGMQMPGRKESLDSYRYGHNGKENDNEVKGEGNQQDYGMRIYDPRVGRFLSVDPISAQYPELTPYQFASNRPIDGIDLDGLEFLPVNDKKFNNRRSSGGFISGCNSKTYGQLLRAEFDRNYIEITIAGKQYYDIGRHLYHTKNGFADSGPRKKQATEATKVGIQLIANYDALPESAPSNPSNINDGITKEEVERTMQQAVKFRNCGGVCYATSIARVNKAYSDIGQSTPIDPTVNVKNKDYKMASSYDGYGGYGVGGVLLNKGLGQAVNNIWGGELQTGAQLQVWHPLSNGGGGHSRIFHSYLYNSSGEITGMNVIDNNRDNSGVSPTMDVIYKSTTDTIEAVNVKDHE